MTAERLQQIEELYHSARERNPAEREAFIAGACYGDEELQREVISLLVQDSAREPMQPLDKIAAGLFVDSRERELQPGTQIGPYEIQGRLGEGGMGKVYKARDTRLGRTVAIKIANQEFSGRFQHEAQAISAFNHPHICTLYDVGADYLVMELVEGDTLAGCLRKGRLPLKLALQYGCEIADALAAAHAKGITHRDLKPANIMVTRTGTKVLDFGLAKLAPAGAADGHSISAQAIVGTPAYMAPEQLEGKPCDARTDIFSLGLVLYEMATGNRAFLGDSRAALIAAIMQCEPELDKVSPPELAHVIERCLDKVPDSRWQTARDVAAELRWVAQARDKAKPAPSRSSHRIAWILAAVSLAALLLLARLQYFRASHSEPATVEFNVFQPPGTQSFAVDFCVAISPDGKQIALRAIGADGRNALWTRSLNSAIMHPLAGTTGATGFFWSPDSQYIAFFSGRLWKVDLRGGPPVELTPSPVNGALNSTGTWGRDGSILFSDGRVGASLYRIPRQGAPVEQVTKANPSLSEEHRGPEFLPDGRHYLYSRRSTQNPTWDTYLGQLGRQEAKLLVSGASHARYVRPPGASHPYLIFERNQILMAQSFDEQGQKVSGDPWPVAPQPLTYWRSFSASPNGVVAYRAGNPDSVLVWVNRAGKIVETLPVRGDYRTVALSPDESMAALARIDPDAPQFLNMWAVELARGTATRLSPGGTQVWESVWSPDGSRVAYAFSRLGPFDIHVRDANGSGPEEVMVRSSAQIEPASWSPDGKFLAYDGAGIWILPVPGGKPFAFLAGAEEPQFSPDGDWIAYSSGESGRAEIYLRKFDGGPAKGGAKRISIDGGAMPRWRHDGKELFFLSPDRVLMSVEATTTPVVRTGIPRALFEFRSVSFIGRNTYAVSRNGQRFLILKPLAEAASGPLTVIANWNPGAQR